MNDTIVAISSGNINQPISIIRLSGADAFAIVKKIFTGKQGQNKTITFGKIMEEETEIDEVLVSWFVGPNTFTGENIVEINAHGGVVNTNKILRLLLASGARIAEKGEFSKRAFLNGKMDLLKAEAIHDMIFAKTEEQTLFAAKQMDGITSKLITKLIDKLLYVIATIETNIDYPEYDDIEKLNNQKIKPVLKNVLQEIINIKEASKSSKFIFEGVNVSIVGRPNAGKSSLLNKLLNEDKAIISSTPGTTRDIVEGSLQLGQVLLKLKDTAGIHFSNNDIEKQGILKAKNEIKNNDFIIHVIDGGVGETAEDKEIEKLSANKIYIKTFNKSDLKKHNGISISIKNDDLYQLFSAIKDSFQKIDLNNQYIINNVRQLSEIDKAIVNIKTALEGISNSFEPDEVILDIRNAWKNLASILGKGTNENLLDKMFSNFCLGK